MKKRRHKRHHYWHQNHDAIACAVEEVFKLDELGCTGIIVYDLGLLRILNQMRSKGAFSRQLLFIVSTHCMVVNSIIAQIYVENGADNIITPHDLGLPVLQEMRKSLPDSIPLSIPLDMYKTKGGFVRYYEIPELVQIASPLFLKLGASAQHHPYDDIGQDTLYQRVKCILVALDHLRKSSLQVKYLNKASDYWCIPK